MTRHSPHEMDFSRVENNYRESRLPKKRTRNRHLERVKCSMILNFAGESHSRHETFRDTHPRQTSHNDSLCSGGSVILLRRFAKNTIGGIWKPRCQRVNYDSENFSKPHVTSGRSNSVLVAHCGVSDQTSVMRLYIWTMQQRWGGFLA